LNVAAWLKSAILLGAANLVECASESHDPEAASGNALIQGAGAWKFGHRAPTTRKQSE
jgi:hypothetical protein